MDETGPTVIEQGVPVIDLLGRNIGRVRGWNGDEIDVALAPRYARELGMSDLHVPVSDIVDADDHEVTLREEAPFIAHPESRPSASDSSF